MEYWNSLIRWHCKHGELANALELFTKMQEQGGLNPDPKIFITIISRLGEQGKLDVIKNNFDKMKFRGHQRSGAIYAVLVYIYGQYGRFQDAEECINALKSEGVQLSAGMFCLLANAYAQQVSFPLVPSFRKVLDLFDIFRYTIHKLNFPLLLISFLIHSIKSG